MIYVDELRDYGKKGRWCHLWTDGDIEALHTFAARLGLKRQWFQTTQGISGPFPHYDLVYTKRVQALQSGAVFMPLKVWIAKQMSAPSDG
jgi:hypothetical protein